MSITPIRALQRLEAIRLDFGAGRAADKLALLRVLERKRLRSSGAVLRLHEQLCFMRAYPDDRAVLARVKGMLDAFAHRPDLRQHRVALADSGIAGTRIHYCFYWPTVRWLAERWPEQLRIDWDAVNEPDQLNAVLPLLVTPIEAAWLRERGPSPRVALTRLNGRRHGDGTFLVRRIEALPGNDFTREALADGLDTPLVVDPGADTPSRTLAQHAGSPVVLVTAPLRRARPDLRAELRRPPQSIRAAAAGEAGQLIDLAHGALVTRLRDIDGIAYANSRDVWVVDDGDGLQWAFIGVVPERRQLLRASYGFVTLRSGVPIGYGQMDTLFRCADVSFNSFDTFRGAETAWIFVRLLAATRALLGACAFTLDGYQLGHHNDEAIASGAWWFYCKLGFRPRSVVIRQLADAEMARMQSSPGRRSSIATLRRLSADSMVFATEGVRAPHWPRLADPGAMVAERMAARGGADREAVIKECSRNAMRLLGLKTLDGLAGDRADVRRSWERWASLVELLPVSGWSLPERRALAAVIAAKGGDSEREYLRQFDAHPLLAVALRALMRASSVRVMFVARGRRHSLHGQ